MEKTIRIKWKLSPQKTVPILNGGVSHTRHFGERIRLFPRFMGAISHVTGFCPCSSRLVWRACDFSRWPRILLDFVRFMLTFLGFVIYLEHETKNENHFPVEKRGRHSRRKENDAETKKADHSTNFGNGF